MELCRFAVEYGQLEMPKIAFQKVASSLFPFYHCTGKSEDIALKFDMHVACIKLYNIYSVFYNTTILDFIGIYF